MPTISLKKKKKKKTNPNIQEKIPLYPLDQVDYFLWEGGLVLSSCTVYPVRLCSLGPSTVFFSPTRTNRFAEPGFMSEPDWLTVLIACLIFAISF